jgi:exodeoxyribonuclease V beta subunit
MDAADCPDGRRHPAKAHRPVWPPLVLGRLTPIGVGMKWNFIFPWCSRCRSILQVPGCTLSAGPCREMVIRGFIDLVFFWQGRYYIADWKSNRLPEGYDQAAMAGRWHQPVMPFSISYTRRCVAMAEDQLGDRFDPHRHFGGAFYIFIRGMGQVDQMVSFMCPLNSCCRWKPFRKRSRSRFGA